MICETVEEFVDALPSTGALLGLDLGEKTIGVAVSDTVRYVASPLETVRRKKFGVDAARLLTLIAERDVRGLVLGLPRNMDGSEGPFPQASVIKAKGMTGTPFLFANLIPRELNEEGSKIADRVF